MENKKTLENFFETMEKTYLPNGEKDIKAGAKETQRIFSNLLTQDNARSVFVKLLIKILMSDQPIKDVDFIEKLKISGLEGTTINQREDFIRYYNFITLATTKLNKSVKDVVFENGDYKIIESTPNRRKKLRLLAIIFLLLIPLYYLVHEQFSNKEIRNICLSTISYNGEIYYLKDKVFFNDAPYFKTQKEALAYCMLIVKKFNEEKKY